VKDKGALRKKEGAKRIKERESGLQFFDYLL
jgi:hypothetical protein